MAQCRNAMHSWEPGLLFHGIVLQPQAKTAATTTKTRQAFGSLSRGSRNELQKKVFWAAVQGMQMGRGCVRRLRTAGRVKGFLPPPGTAGRSLSFRLAHGQTGITSRPGWPGLCSHLPAKSSGAQVDPGVSLELSRVTSSGRKEQPCSSTERWRKGSAVSFLLLRDRPSSPLRFRVSRSVVHV